MCLKKKKKHVLFIVENSTVPNDPRVWKEAQTVKSFGYNVTIISPKKKFATKYFEIIDGIDIHRYPILNISKGKLAFFIEYTNALFWQAIISLWIYIKKPFHIIHAANPPDNIFIISLVFKILGVKYIFDHHDLSPELYLVKFLKRKDIFFKTLIFLEKISCKLADAIVSTNESYKRIVVNRHNINPKKIFIVRNDPIVKDFTKDNCFKFNKDKFNKGKKIILYIGAINQQDGVNILLQVINYLVYNLKRIDFICNIIGDGDSLVSVMEDAKQLNLIKYVYFKGFIKRRENIIEQLYLSDVCVEPAPDNELNRFSTFIKIMEYMAVGKPIVAFDLLETRYSAENAAILVKPVDIKGFANAINKLLDDPTLRRRLGKIGLDRIKNKLNWENNIANIKRLYHSLNI